MEVLTGLISPKASPMRIQMATLLLPLLPVCAPRGVTLCVQISSYKDTNQIGLGLGTT